MSPKDLLATMYHLLGIDRARACPIARTVRSVWFPTRPKPSRKCSRKFTSTSYARTRQVGTLVE